MWSLRRCWPHEKEQIKDELRSGSYRFSLLSRVTLKNGEDADLWSARDALVLKALALVLAKQTIANFIEKASRLYEQKRSAGSSVTALEVYVRQWLRWSRAGLESGRLISSTIIEDDA